MFITRILTWGCFGGSSDQMLRPPQPTFMTCLALVLIFVLIRLTTAQINHMATSDAMMYVFMLRVSLHYRSLILGW